CAALVLAPAVHARGQVSRTSPQGEGDGESDGKGELEHLPTPPPSAALIDPASEHGAGAPTSEPLGASLTLGSSGGSQTVSATLGGSTDDLMWYVKVSSPLGEGNPAAIAADLDGLA